MALAPPSYATGIILGPTLLFTIINKYNVFLQIMASEGGSEEMDLISLMREVLPEYVVHCFLAAGYNVPDVTTSMNISEEPGNSIDLIEKYINDQHKEDPKYRFN